MTVRTWIRKLFAPKTRTIRKEPVRFRPRLEALEDRTLLSNPATTGDLITAIQNANTAGGATTITLAANTTFNFTSADNSTNGANALPVITGKITIVGNGDTIERTGTKVFRLFDVASGGSLTLENLTLTGGLAQGTGVAADGGAVYSSGTLTLSGVTVTSNRAEGSNGANATKLGAAGGTGANAYGGGLYVAGGTVTLSNDTFHSNIAVGGLGGNGGPTGGGGNGGSGGMGLGGGMYVAGGAVTLSNDTLRRNLAFGGRGGLGIRGGSGGSGGSGGAGFGGGMDVAGGVVKLNSDTFNSNYAYGGTGGTGGVGAIGGDGGLGAAGSGGGMFVAGGAVTLSNDTLSENNAIGGIGGNGGGSIAIAGGGGAGGSGSGGGVDVAGGTVTLINDTLSDNNAKGGIGGNGANGGIPAITTANGTHYSGGNGSNGGGGGNGMGGGLYVASGSKTILANSLIAVNTVKVGRGGFAGKGGTNGTYTAPFGNPGSSGSTSAPDVSGTVTSSDHDLIGDGTGSNLTNGTNSDQVGTSSSPINPKLGSLQDNGGPTQTMALWTGSPAIDAGDNNAVPAATDQRGYGRIAGNAIDIGAYEYGAMPAFSDLSISGNAPTTVAPGSQITYTLTVSSPDGPNTNVSLVDVLPANTTLVSWTAPPFGWTSSVPAAGTSATLSFWNSYMDPGEFGIFQLTVQVNSNTPLGTVLSNTASFGPITGDPTPSDNSVSLQTTVRPTPTLALTDAGGTYNGNPSPATATAVGSNGQNVSGSFSLDYYDNTTSTDLGSTAPTNAGNYTVTANFTSSDADYSNGSAQTTFTISPAATTTSTVSLSSATAVYGQPVTLTATVTNTQTSVTPSGSVTFYDGATKLQAVAVGSGGVATLILSTRAAGKHSLTASFSDPAGNFTSTSSHAAASLTIGKASTTTTLTATTNTPVFGQAVTFTATVAALSPSVATPTGSVTFKDGSTVLATVALSGGSASFTTKHLALGGHAITAYYNGTSNFGTSHSSPADPVTVSPDSTQAVVTSSVSKPVYGQPMTLTAKVTASAPGSGTPTGMVTFYDGTTSLGTATLSNGVASLKNIVLPAGVESLTVVYGGDTNFQGTTSAILSLTVSQDKTTTGLMSSSPTAAAGTPVTFTATVLPVSPGSGTPTGTVSFWDGSVQLQTVNLSNGVAKLSYTFLLPAVYKIKAVYNGDSDFLSSTSSVLTETIN
jgi:uncharacterized repeat protein (TIGR01451 family)